MSRSALPGSWAEVYERLAQLLCDEPAAREWIRQALEATWGVLDPVDLDRARRGLALQKASGVLLALEDEPGDLAFTIGVRAIVRRAVARYFAGHMVDGPRWRLDPSEVDRPTYAETSADFGDEEAVCDAVTVG